MGPGHGIRQPQVRQQRRCGRHTQEGQGKGTSGWCLDTTYVYNNFKPSRGGWYNTNICGIYIEVKLQQPMFMYRCGRFNKVIFPLGPLGWWSSRWLNPYLVDHPIGFQSALQPLNRSNGCFDVLRFAMDVFHNWLQHIGNGFFCNQFVVDSCHPASPSAIHYDSTTASPGHGFVPLRCALSTRWRARGVQPVCN